MVQGLAVRPPAACRSEQPPAPNDYYRGRLAMMCRLKRYPVPTKEPVSASVNRVLSRGRSHAFPCLNRLLVEEFRSIIRFKPRITVTSRRYTPPSRRKRPAMTASAAKAPQQ